MGGAKSARTVKSEAIAGGPGSLATPLVFPSRNQLIALVGARTMA